MKYTLTLKGHHFSWNNSSWGFADFTTNFGDDPQLFYINQAGEKQIFRLVPSYGKYLGYRLMPVDISGFVLIDNIGTGAPIGAFMRELAYTKVGPTS